MESARVQTGGVLIWGGGGVFWGGRRWNHMAREVVWGTAGMRAPNWGIRNKHIGCQQSKLVSG